MAISPDQPARLRESVQQKKLRYRLLSDSSMQASKGFGLAYRVAAPIFERLKGMGIDLEEASGEAHHLLPVPALYLVNTQGVVRFQYVNPDYRERIHPDILLAAVRVYGEEKP